MRNVCWRTGLRWYTSVCRRNVDVDVLAAWASRVVFTAADMSLVFYEYRSSRLHSPAIESSLNRAIVVSTRVPLCIGARSFEYPPEHQRIQLRHK